jgi:hypothetical protein
MAHPSPKNLALWVAVWAASGAFAAPIAAQGVEVRSGAVVLYGSTSNCTAPSTIDYDRVKKATPEWKTIKSEGVTKGSARFELLVSEMNQRIKRLAQQVAQSSGRDCVVRKGDIGDAKGMEVTDLTDDVIGKIDS